MARPKTEEAPVVTGTSPPEHSVNMFSLRSLTRAPENVRTDAPNGDISELAEDIAGHGLLQSLIGYSTPDGIAIVGGGRRLAALQFLLEQGRITNLFPVPVQVRDYDEAIELSLAENLARRDMNPVDEYFAFKRLIELAPATTGPAEIARRFGYTERHVRQRLRLADLSGVVLDALRSGKIGVESAMAYATTLDHDLQNKVFAQQEKSHYQPHNALTVRSVIRGEQLTDKSALFLFVGKKAYEKAGGRYDEDLFSDLDPDAPRTLLDPDLLIELATPKMEKAAKKLVAEGGFTDFILTKDLMLTGAVSVPKEWKRVTEHVEYQPYRCITVGEQFATAKKKKIDTCAIVGLGYGGGGHTPRIHHDFLVSRQDRDRLIPKAKNAEPEMTDEERRAKIAAENRERAITYQAWALAVRKRIKLGTVRGHLFFGRSTWLEEEKLELAEGDETFEHDALFGTMQFAVTKEEVELFRSEAELLHDQKIREAEEAKAQEEARKQEIADEQAELARRLVYTAPPVIATDGEVFFLQERNADCVYATIPNVIDSEDEYIELATWEEVYDAVKDDLDSGYWMTVEAVNADEEPLGLETLPEVPELKKGMAVDYADRDGKVHRTSIMEVGEAEPLRVSIFSSAFSTLNFIGTHISNIRPAADLTAEGAQTEAPETVEDNGIINAELAEATE